MLSEDLVYENWNRRPAERQETATERELDKPVKTTVSCIVWSVYSNKELWYLNEIKI